MLERDSRVIRRRAKSRNACGTCKKRHVKCDETKPLCNRCIKFGIACDGYQTAKRLPNLIAKARPLISRAQEENIIYSPSTHVFANGQEFYSFRQFCGKTALRISGFFDTDLWSRLVPQACDVYPAIRHAVVAIGALDYLLEISRGISVSSRGAVNKISEETQKHHRFALRQYGAAIRQMRNSASEENVDIRRTLLSCIVITCFETLHGNLNLAISTIQSGISLLEEWQMQNTEGRDNILGVSSALPLTVEDELVQTLGRLDIQLMSFVDIRSKEIHDRMRQYGLPALQSMPKHFSNVKMARIYLEVIMRRIMHFRACLSSSKQNGLLKITFPTPDFLEGALKDHRAYMAELQRWRHAFKPMWDRFRTQDGTLNFYGVTVLRIHYLASYFALKAMPLDPLEALISKARVIPICQETISLSRVLLKNSIADNATFNFDLQIVPWLYLMGMRCPDLQIRQAAIALLSVSPRREGVWDGRVVGMALKWIANLEEGDVLEKVSEQDMEDIGDLNWAFGHKGNMVVDTAYNFDKEAMRVIVKCWWMKRGQDRWVKREIEIPW